MTDDRTKLPPGVTFVCDDRGTPIGVVLDPDSDFAGRSKGNEDEADDVWAMVDRWRAEGAEKERERLAKNAAKVFGVGQFYLLGRAIQEWIIEGGKDPSE